MKKLKLNDEEYIEGFKNKDSYVIDLFYEENFHLIKEDVQKRRGTITDAEDVMQLCMLHLYNNLNKTDFLLWGELQNYFLVIGQNVWSQISKTRINTKRAESEASKLLLLQDSENETLRLEEQMTLYSNSFKLLSPICQELIKNRHNKKPYKEIVEELDLKSVESARQRKHYCQEKLISIIKNRKEY